MIEWEEAFEPASLPEWFYAFEGAPGKALDDLLFGRVYLGHLNVADPGELLMEWASVLGERGNFIQRLDGALHDWVTENWGRFPPVSAARLAVAWCRVADAVAFLDGLERSAEVLAAYFDDRELYLGPLSDGISRDALGRYLFAIGRHQKDRQLAPFWWQLCDLNDGTPFHHGRYAIAGIQGLPPVQNRRGEFPEEVARALVKLGTALDRLVAEKLLPPSEAEEHFLEVARHTVAAYPFRLRWRQALFPDLAKAPGRLSDWLRKLVPDIDKPLAQSPGSQAVWNPTWQERGQELERELAQNPNAALPRAERLLAEQRAYAGISGDVSGLKAALCALSRGIRAHHPLLAAEWAEEATRWEPWDARSWSHWIKALLVAGNRTLALSIAWEAAERFPENEFVSTQLAQSLMSCGRLTEAEHIAIEGVDRFPGNEFVRTTLFSILRCAQKLPEAERVCEEARSKFKDNYRWWINQAQVLVLQEKFTRAEEVLQDATEKFPREIYPWSFLGAVLSRQHRLVDSEQVLRQAIGRFNDPTAKVSLAGTLRRQGRHRLEEALSLVEDVLTTGQNRHHALAEKARILDDTGKMAEALAVWEEVGTQPDEPFDQLSGFLGETDSAWRQPDAEGGLALFPGEEPGFEPEGRRMPGTRERPSRLETGKRREAPHLPSLDRWAETAKISEARLLRRWARRNEATGESPWPRDLRQKADVLLDRVLATNPNHPKACSEKAHLLIECGLLDEARLFLDGKISLIPAALSLRQALARLNREIARMQQFPFSEERYAELTSPLLQLQERNPAFLPLVHLGRGRACLAMRDGWPLQETAVLRRSLRASGCVRKTCTLLREASTTTAGALTRSKRISLCAWFAKLALLDPLARAGRPRTEIYGNIYDHIQRRLRPGQRLETARVALPGLLLLPPALQPQTVGQGPLRVVKNRFFESRLHPLYGSR